MTNTVIAAAAGLSDLYARSITCYSISQLILIVGYARSITCYSISQLILIVGYTTTTEAFDVL